MNRLVTSASDAQELARRIAEASRYGWDTESHGPELVMPRKKKRAHGEMINMYRSTTTGMSLHFASDDTAFYVPLAHRSGNLAPSRVRVIAEAMASSKAVAVSHGLKHERFAVERSEDLRMPANPVCSLVGAWTASLRSGHPQKMYALKLLAKAHLGMNMQTFEDVSKGRQFYELSPEEALSYACDDARAANMLWPLIEARFEKYNLTKCYYDQELPLVDVVYDMEHAGFAMDEDGMWDLGFEAAAMVKALRTRLEELAPVNPNSPQQVASLFYDVFGEWSADLLERTATGAYPVNADALGLHVARSRPGSLGHEYAKTLLEYKAIHKNSSTYTFNFLKIADNYPDGRLHPNVLLHGTDTGRISMTDPNLMNIPVRTEFGRKIREMFVAEEGNKLVSADYSQIELRLLAHITKDANLLKAFREGQDVHQATADLCGITRSEAKIVNFAYIYGAGKNRLAKQIGCTPEKAGAFIKRYRKAYPGVPEWLEKHLANVRRTGYVRTLGGNAMFLPDIRLPGNDEASRMRRSYAERQAGNIPFQGGAANIVKRAMVRVAKAFKQHLPGEAVIINQVHDDIVCRVVEARAERAGELLKGEMEATAKLSVPLVADLKISYRWEK